eukprot:8741104-Lingulodinium_polyedra.AAC.1
MQRRAALSPSRFQALREAARAGACSVRGLIPHPAVFWPRPARPPVEEVINGGTGGVDEFGGQVFVDGSMIPGEVPELDRAGCAAAAFNEQGDL